MLIAVTRPVSAALARCELTHLAREPLNVARAGAQHAAYEQLLRSLGATIVRVPGAPELPDAVFVEDTAVVLDELAVITRPGARSRRAEPAAVADVLCAHRTLVRLAAPATLDGGDVLRLGRTLYVGRAAQAARTNAAGVEQLRSAVAPFGYRVAPIEFAGCLHLKSAVTALGPELLLVNPAWVDVTGFDGCDSLAVDEREPHAANALPIAETIVFPAHLPHTRDLLLARGLRVAVTACDELARAEGAVTCCSLVFVAGDSPAA